MDTLEAVGRLIVTPVAIVAALAWVARSAITYFMSKDIGRFKDQLAAAAHERSTKFSILQARRAEVIAELYAKLTEFMGATEKLISPFGYEGDPSKEEQLQTVGSTRHAFLSYYIKNRIYFSVSVCDGIDGLVKTLNPAITKFGMWMVTFEKYPESKNNRVDAWDTAWKTMEDSVPPIMKSIEADFRSLLGVEIGDKPS